MHSGDIDAWRQRPSSFLPQLIAWEPEHEEEATVVTVRPNFQDNVHVGYVAGLRKFAEYFTSVLCFTTPGDGPRSPPQLVRTHEDGTGRLCVPAGRTLPTCGSRGGWEQPQDGGLGPTGAAGGDVERGATEPRGAPSMLSPCGVPVGAESSCPGVRGCVLSLGIFGQCLALWDTSASVTSWTRP